MELRKIKNKSVGIFGIVAVMQILIMITSTASESYVLNQNNNFNGVNVISDKNNFADFLK